MRATRIALAAVTLLMLVDADAQISTPPRATADYLNAVGIGISYGEKLRTESDFWGWSASYSRLLNDSWTAGLSLTWDKDTEQIIGRPDKIVRTYALIATISYNLTPRASLTTGLAQNIADDDNATGAMRFRSGDVSTGLSLGYTWPLSKRHALGASLAYEYNISAKEPDISIDISLGRSF